MATRRKNFRPNIAINRRCVNYVNSIIDFDDGKVDPALKELESLSWFHPAAYFYGKTYFNGDKVPKDLTKGLDYLKKAASLGSNNALDTLARVSKNKKEKRFWKQLRKYLKSLPFDKSKHKLQGRSERERKLIRSYVLNSGRFSSSPNFFSCKHAINILTN